MHKLVQDLGAKLKKMRFQDSRRGEIRRVYKQLVPGRRSGKQEEGDYKNFAEGGSEGLLELLLFVDDKLKEYGMKPHSRRLQEYYHGLYKTHYHTPDKER